MFFDTDAGGVVHNIAYLRFIETARTLLADQFDLSMKTMVETGRFAVVARTEIDYRRPGALGDHLVVHGWLESLEKSRFWCAFEVKRVGDGATLVRCRQKMAMVQMPEGRAIRLPEAWAERFPHLLAKGEEVVG